MLKNSLSEEVVSSLMALINCGKQEHHIFKEVTFAWPLTNIIDTLHNNIIDNLTGISIDENNPLVNNVSFILELDFYCL